MQLSTNLGRVHVKQCRPGCQRVESNAEWCVVHRKETSAHAPRQRSYYCILASHNSFVQSYRLSCFIRVVSENVLARSETQFLRERFIETITKIAVL